ncbi:MAG: hypothetical protein MUO76_16140, partial [Anaerolineaceae bacterium]|nr:hypothetical protein [Anaerolineaceae bacterium]
MGKGILILSPQNDFSELLRLSLEENEAYSVHFAQSVEEVLSKIKTEEICLVILDTNATDQPIVSIGQAIQEQAPNLPLAVIPPQNNSEHPSLAGFEWDGFVSRPFFKPDLLDLVNDLTQSFAEQAAQEKPFREPASEEESELSLEDELELIMSGGGIEIETPTEISVFVPEEPPFTAAEQLLHDLQKQFDSQAAPAGGVPLQDGAELSLEEELELLLDKGKSSLTEPHEDMDEILHPENKIIEETLTPQEPTTQSSDILSLDDIAKVFDETSQTETQIQSELNGISEEEFYPEDMLESVMSQLESQTVTQNNEDLSTALEEELSETPPHLEDTAVISMLNGTPDVSLPGSFVTEPAIEIKDDSLENMISQIESQSIPVLDEEFMDAEDSITADKDTGTPSPCDIADETPAIPIPLMEIQAAPDHEQEEEQILPDKTELVLESELDQLLNEEESPTNDEPASDSVLQDILAQLVQQKTSKSEEDTIFIDEDELSKLETEESIPESEAPEQEGEEELVTETSKEMTYTFQEVLDRVEQDADMGEDD